MNYSVLKALPLESKTDIKMILFPTVSNKILRWFCVILKIKEKEKVRNSFTAPTYITSIWLNL